MLPDSVAKFTSFIALLGFLPYIISVVKGKTSPARITWITWLALMVGTSISMYAGGERRTLWLPIGYAAGDMIVVLLAIKRGHGGWSVVDRLCLVGIGIGLLTLWLLKSPEERIACLIVASTIGFIPTIIKINNNPASEDMKAWLIWLFADLLCLLTIRQWTFLAVAYPITSFLKCSVVVLRVMTMRRT